MRRKRPEGYFMKTILIAALMMSSTTLFANEFQDEMKDVKTPTALTEFLGSIRVGDGAPQATVCGSNEATNEVACVTGSPQVLKSLEKIFRKLGIKHDVNSPDAGQGAGGN